MTESNGSAAGVRRVLGASSDFSRIASRYDARETCQTPC